jgi:hypothetical protein
VHEVVVQVILALNGFYVMGVEGIGIQEAGEQVGGFLDVVAGAFEEGGGVGEGSFPFGEALEGFHSLRKKGDRIMRRF